MSSDGRERFRAASLCRVGRSTELLRADRRTRRRARRSGWPVPAGRRAGDRQESDRRRADPCRPDTRGRDPRRTLLGGERCSGLLAVGAVASPLRSRCQARRVASRRARRNRWTSARVRPDTPSLPSRYTSRSRVARLEQDDGGQAGRRMGVSRAVTASPLSVGATVATRVLSPHKGYRPAEGEPIQSSWTKSAIHRDDPPRSNAIATQCANSSMGRSGPNSRQCSCRPSAPVSSSTARETSAPTQPSPPGRPTPEPGISSANRRKRRVHRLPSPLPPARFDERCSPRTRCGGLFVTVTKEAQAPYKSQGGCDRIELDSDRVAVPAVDRTLQTGRGVARGR